MCLDVKLFVYGCGRDKILRRLIKSASKFTLYQTKDETELNWWIFRYDKFKRKYKNRFKSQQKLNKYFLQRIKYERRNFLLLTVKEEVCVLLRIKYGKVSQNNFIKYCREIIYAKNKNVFISPLNYYSFSHRDFIERPVEEIYKKQNVKELKF